MSRRLLLVDDEQMVLTALRRVLSKVGYEVVTAASGEEALETIGAQSFGCVITDLRMPGMGGHGLIRECRQLHPNLPLMVMSAHGDMDDVIECLREGVADYIRKPWSDTELRSMVAKHFRMEAAEARGPAAVAPAPAAPPPAPAPPPAAAPVAVAAPPAAAPPAPAAAMAAPAAGAGALTAERRAALLRQIAGGDMEMPTSPAITLATRALASSEHASASALRELVEQDVGMASQIIRVANGPLYAGLGRVSALQAAIARIGFREVSHLADTLLAQRFFAPTDRRWQTLLRSVWRQSWRRAVVARYLAENVKIGLAPERAYLSTLFCDLGVPLLCRAVHQHAPELGQEEAQELVESSHMAFGATVAAHWKLPPECAVVCTHHHNHDLGAGDEVPMPLRVAWAAEALAAGRYGVAQHPPMPALPVTRLLPVTQPLIDLVMSRADQYVQQHEWALDEAVGDSGPAAAPAGRAASAQGGAARLS